MSPNAKRYQSFSDNANVDLPGDESAFVGEGDGYGSVNQAGRGAKRRLAVRVDEQGRYVGLGLVSFDPKDVYTANAAWVRSAKPVDPAEIVYHPTSFQHPDGRWAAATEIAVRQWELKQVIDESSYPLVRRAA